MRFGINSIDGNFTFMSGNCSEEVLLKRGNLPKLKNWLNTKQTGFFMGQIG